jgi:hypothetical protein
MTVHLLMVFVKTPITGLSHDFRCDHVLFFTSKPYDGLSTAVLSLLAEDDRAPWQKTKYVPLFSRPRFLAQLIVDERPI